MPYTDDDGDRVEKGEKKVVTRTVSVSAATATVNMNGLTNVTKVLGARTNGQGQVDEANDEAVEATLGSGDDEVDIAFFTAQAGPAIASGAPAAARDVEVIAEGY